MDRRRDLDRLASAIAEIQPDVIGLQEVIRAEGAADADQPAYLASKLSMTAIMGATRPSGKGSFGNVILTRLPVIASTTHDLSHGRYERRGCLRVDLAADGAIVHSGLAQLPDPLVDLGVVKLLIPGLERGLPFRFFNQRAPQAAGEQIEGQSGNWVLQIDCPEVFVPLPFEPGIFVPESTTNPAFLKKFPPPTTDPEPPAVPKPDPRLVVDAGVLEITSDGDFRIRPDFSFHPATPPATWSASGSSRPASSWTTWAPTCPRGSST